MNTPKRPVIRYYGGKWKLADWIISFFPKHKVYVESFGGAGSVLMKKKQARVEIYNDLSEEMVNLFRVLRCPDQSKELRRLLDLTPYSRSEWESCYEFSEDPIEQARRTVVLATMSHNPGKVMRRQTNGFRTSSSGYYRPPQNFTNLTMNLELVTQRLKEVIIEKKPAQEIMLQHDRPSTLHYVDPPYIGSLRNDKRNLYQHEMYSGNDHKRLSIILNKLKGYVIVSGYPSPEYEEYFRGWARYSCQAVTGAATPGKSTRTEVLYLNQRCAAALRQKTLFS
jgi:DNA adenine methylase